MTPIRIRVAQNLFRDAKGNYFGRRKSGGRTIWHDLETTNPDRAKSLLRAWLTSAETLDADAGSFTLGALVLSWLDGKSALKGGSARVCACNARVFQTTFRAGMNMRVSDVRLRHLVQWINHQAVERKWSKTTFNRYRTMLYNLFEIAVANQIIAHSPFDSRQIRRRKPQEITRYIPTAEEFYAIIADVRKQNGGRRPGGNGQHSADFLRLLGEACVGQAEAQDLRWEDLGESHITFTRRKTGIEFRVPLFNFAGEPCLAEFIAKLRRQPHSPTGPVFNVANPKGALDKACDRLRFRRYTPRNLRQFGIVRLLRKGASFKDVGDWQGHQDGGFLIATRYAFVQAADKDAQEARTLARLFANGGAETAPAK
jgi:integrase